MSENSELESPKTQHISIKSTHPLLQTHCLYIIYGGAPDFQIGHTAKPSRGVANQTHHNSDWFDVFDCHEVNRTCHSNQSTGQSFKSFRLSNHFGDSLEFRSFTILLLSMLRETPIGLVRNSDRTSGKPRSDFVKLRSDFVEVRSEFGANSDSYLHKIIGGSFKYKQ